MTANVTALHSAWVELSSPGMYRDGRRFYVVDLVEADGEASTMWGGTDLAEARRAAHECADDGAGNTIPVRDLTSPAH